MRIGIDVSRTQAPVLTGTERYTYEVVHRLPALHPEIQWRLFSDRPFHSRWSSQLKNIEYRVLPSRIGTAWSHTRLGPELRRHPVDLMFYPGTAIPLSARGPIVTTIHDLVFLTHPHLYAEKTTNNWKRRAIEVIGKAITLGRYSGGERAYQLWAYHQAMKCATRIISVSSATHNSIKSLTPEHPPLITIPLGIDTPQNTDHDQQLGGNNTDPYFVFIGRLERKKNLDRLLEAYNVYCTTNANPWPLVLIGQPGFGWPEIEHRHKTLLTSNHVRLLGGVGDQERESILSRASALFLVSEAEGFGLPAFEAAIRHVPVIASPVGAIPEYFQDAYIKIDPRDIASMTAAMSKMTQHPDSVGSMTTIAFERIRGMTWDICAEKTAEVLLGTPLKSKDGNGIIRPL